MKEILRVLVVSSLLLASCGCSLAIRKAMDYDWLGDNPAKWKGTSAKPIEMPPGS